MGASARGEDEKRNTETKKTRHSSLVVVSAARVTREVVRARMANVARAVRFRPCVDIHDGKVKQIVEHTAGRGHPGGRVVERRRRILRRRFRARRTRRCTSEMESTEGTSSC